MRYREIKATIYRTGLTENLSQETITDNKGEAIFIFSKWHDGISVDSTNVQQMDIEFPNTDKVIRVGKAINFEPLKFESVEFKGRTEGITIILPMTVYTKMDTVGVGPCMYAFAIMTDLHIAEGKKKQPHIVGSDTLWLEDFGSPGFNDTDNDPNETTPAIDNNINIVAKINQLMGPGYNYPIKFVGCLGDITSTSERSEYQRTKKVLSNLQVPWIPILGNHDTWPYIGNSSSYMQQSASTVKIGEYFSNAFKSRYDSLRYFFAVPNWHYSNECTTAVSSSESYKSFYLNSAFDYQGYHFICTDFNTRGEAYLGLPGTSPCADVDKGQSWDYSWDWLHNEITNQRKMIILNHHPLMVMTIVIRYCFSPSGISDIRDAGLKNNRPIATWFGGHLHPGHGTYFERRIIGSDTLADVYNLNQASKDGYLYIVFVRDSVNIAEIYCTPGGNPYSSDLDFIPYYYGYGSSNYAASYSWDFGDGGTSNQQNPTHIYHLYANWDTLYKVTLTVTTNIGKKVSWAKVIPVGATPYNLSTAFPGFVKEDSVKLLWSFDCPQLIDCYWVYRGGTQIDGDIPPNQKWYIDDGVHRGAQYVYQVYAKRGTVSSPPCRTILVQIPWVDAPTLRQAVEVPPNQVQISWHNNSIYAQKYIVHRWDDITNQWHYGYHQANSPIETLFVDNVEWLHKYKYVVVARATNASYDTSAWSNVVEFTCGVLAQSNYSRMSAYNNGAKIARYGNNVLV
ncbi:MAG: PKD domain-containing protein [candidate division WOR-3 bacterium]